MKEITIAPTMEVTLADRIGRALDALDKAILHADGGRKCDELVWSRMHECRFYLLRASEKANKTT